MTDQPAYQVFARKYRPETFDDLVGQDTMVKTLRNAFSSGRIAQAFIMTGIRGTGKTTTARIIAKGMNCIGPDGTGGPTVDPCGQCEHCTSIMEGRHVDVMEMDAASRTGVGDIREIIDSVQYRAASARYKIYIIDEVHMLSNSAFNALLKTLEEPPEHVKFIFATTEIRKVPVTVLSRCQRFDLRRIEPEDMIAMLQRIATAESAEIDHDALALITRAAEGSARDAQSLLDQALSHEGAAVSVDDIRTMLGLADQERVLDLFDHIMSGRAADALAELSSQYSDGADPAAILRDLAEVTHWISLIKVTPEAAEDPTVPPGARTRGLNMAQTSPKRALSRMWQLCLSALDEVRLAPNAMMAAEMAVIRMTHVAELPTPGEIIAKLQDMPPTSPPPAGRASQSPTNTTQSTQYSPPSAPMPSSDGPRAALQPAIVPDENPLARYQTFQHVVALIREHRDVRLLVEVEGDLRLVNYSPGRIEFTPTETAAPDLAQRLASRLSVWTGSRWGISVVSGGDQPTLAEDRDAKQNALEQEALAHPFVQSVIAQFPKAKITDITSFEEIDAKAMEDALPEIEDDWNPLDDD